jgi:hypothetical protein
MKFLEANPHTTHQTLQKDQYAIAINMIIILSINSVMFVSILLWSIPNHREVGLYGWYSDIARLEGGLDGREGHVNIRRESSMLRIGEDLLDGSGGEGGGVFIGRRGGREDASSGVQLVLYMARQLNGFLIHVFFSNHVTHLPRVLIFQYSSPSRV